MNLRIALTALVAAGLTITVPAFAEGRDPAAADALFRSAREAFARGDYATACPRFAESQRLDPAVGTLLNLSACEEKLGKLTVSYAHLVEAIEKLPPRDARLKAATERRDALKSKIPSVTVVAPEDPKATVLRDDVELRAGAFDVALPIDPGTYVFLVRADGREPSTETVTVREGETRTVTLHLGPPLASKAAPAKMTVAPAAGSPPAPMSRRRAFGIGALAMGGAGVVTGLVTGIMVGSAASTYDARCDATGCDATGLDAASRGKTLEIVSPVAFAVGAVGIGLGTYLIVTSRREGRPASGIALAPELSPRATGLSLVGGF